MQIYISFLIFGNFLTKIIYSNAVSLFSCRFFTYILDVLHNSNRLSKNIYHSI